MPKSKKPGIVDETESTETEETVDETETEETETEATDTSKETTDAEKVTEEEESSTETEEETTTEEEAPETDASAAELSASQQEIKALKEKVAQLEGKKDEPPATTPPARKSAIQAFVSGKLPQTKKQFAEAMKSSITVKDDGTVSINGEAVDKQFDAMYDMTDHLVGSAMADYVEPVQNNLAERIINLENELEIRDLRADKQSGAVFTSLEAQVRDELEKVEFKDRLKPGTVRKIYHRLVGERNGLPPAKPNGGKPASAASALRDVSAGSRPKPSTPQTGFKLTPAQEKDFQEMVDKGFPITRERYHAKWKARADKARAEKRPIPATYRSLS